MVAELPCAQLTRKACVKRKRSEMSPELAEMINKLQRLADQLSSSLDDMSTNLQPLVEILQTQTSVIEALATRRTSKRYSSEHHATPQFHRRGLSFAKSLHRHTVAEDTCRVTYDRTPLPSPGFTVSPLTDSSTPVICSDTPISATSDVSGRIYVNTNQLQIPTIKTPIPSARLRPQTTQLDRTPPTPPSSPPPLSIPTNDSTTSLPLRNKPSFTSSTNASTTSLTNISNTHTDSSISTTSCSACDSEQWDLLDRPDPRDIDDICESHVQEATTSLIVAMKEKKRTPIGPLTAGTFHLYSSNYRTHYCVHDRPDRQSLLVYSTSPTWETEFPGLPAPQPGEVAMELTVYPDCLLIVKPFKVPTYAGWKWHSLDAIGDNAEPTSIELMFLGNGFIKVRVRLSELLGRQAMHGESDRFIEFAGVWTPDRVTGGGTLADDHQMDCMTGVAGANASLRHLITDIDDFSGDDTHDVPFLVTEMQEVHNTFGG